MRLETRIPETRIGGRGGTAGRVGVMVLAAALLGACEAPDLRGMMPGPRAETSAPAPAPDGVAADAFAPASPEDGAAIPRPPASQAEAACMQQGREQGLAVREVVGTREVQGSDGQAVSRDVMLRVARGQQVYDVRCSYHYASAAARIMSL